VAIAPAQRGIGFLLAEDGLAVRRRSFYLDDQAIEQLAQRSAALRHQASTGLRLVVPYATKAWCKFP
jgi:hypothetical protein